MYLVKTPFWLRWLYTDLLWRIPEPQGKNLYLTFDDGPIPIVTPFVLDTLKRHDAKATFFCIGDNIRKHPDIFEKVVRNGHAIGNHTFNHLKGWKTADDVYVDNMLQCRELVKGELFRPPYGRIKKSQVKKLRAAVPGLKIVMWDVLSGDFDIKLRPEKCLKNVLNKAEPGSIIVFHDSRKAWERLEYTLPRALAHWKEQGFAFKTLS